MGEFEKQRQTFQGTGDSKLTPFAKLFAVMYFCKEVFQKYHQPAIITFDNIDLSCEETQKTIRYAVLSVHSELIKLAESKKLMKAFRIFFVARPDFLMVSAEEKMDRINFPLPNILNITLDYLESVVIEAANELDNEKGGLGYTWGLNSIIDESRFTVEKHICVANYFIKIIRHYLANIWDSRPDIVDRLGSSQEFHCLLVNYNVRTFMSFLSHTLKDGGFSPFSKDFEERRGGPHYNVYEYLEMLIRGMWEMHPGNWAINKEGNNRAPIVFNVFDTTMMNEAVEIQVKHFMLNIRIMQWFYSTDSYGREYGSVENKRSGMVLFFDKDLIKAATQKLIQVGILYSKVEGERCIRSKREASEVIINSDSRLSLSDMGEFYLDRLICEFEYLYQMALSSLMLTKQVEHLERHKAYLNEKEEVVCCFLESIFAILGENYESYSDNGKEVYHKEFLESKAKAGQLYIRMIETFLKAMTGKINRALRNKNKAEHQERHSIDRSREKSEKFAKIVARAEKLKDEATARIWLKL